MLKILLTQTSWNIIGTIFGFAIGFFVKMFLVNKVGASDFGLYIIAMQFESAIGTILAFGIPTILLKYLPQYIRNETSDKATRFSTKFFIYTMIVGLAGGIITILFSSIIAKYLFSNIDLSTFILLASFYIPISMYSAYITSMYRSLLKIKEIILYSTFYLVSVRAILTFIVFSFTDDILYFMYIEIFSLLTAAILLTIKFKSDKFKLFDKKYVADKVLNNEIVSYGKKIYSLSLISFFSGYILMFLMSITLESKDIGIYAILVTISGLTNFLLLNINRVFAPIISTLTAQKDYEMLQNVYKDSTFLLNIITIPFILVALIFSKDILGLYGSEFENYTLELFILFLGNYISISVGSSGTMMVMAGLEKESLYLQMFKLIFVLIVSLLFLPTYGLLGAVCIYSIAMLVINVFEVYFINKRLSVYPLDKYSYILFLLFFISLYLVYDYGNQVYNIWYYIFVPIILYSIYFLLFYKVILKIIKTIKENKN